MAPCRIAIIMAALSEGAQPCLSCISDAAWMSPLTSGLEVPDEEKSVIESVDRIFDPALKRLGKLLCYELVVKI